MKSIHWLQHVSFEGLGQIEAVLEKDFKLIPVRLYDGDPLPEVAEVDALILMGGPMGVDDESKFPWLKAEKSFLKDFISQKPEAPVLGVCLGAQLLASSLGAQIRKNAHREIGWFELQLSEAGEEQEWLKILAPENKVLHWHGEMFEYPTGSAELASSRACPNQAFQYKNMVGIQFHLEMRPSDVRRMCAANPDDLLSGIWVQKELAMLDEVDSFVKAHSALKNLLQSLFY